MSFQVENYFKLFGLQPTFLQDVAKLKAHYLQLQKSVHPDNFVDATPQEKMLAVQYAATVNQAYQTLSDPLKRGIYLLKLEGVDTQSETDNVMPIEFLTEQMELREYLNDHMDSDQDIAALKTKIEQALSLCQQNFAQAFECQPKKIVEATMSIKKMQFYTRIYEEILSFA